MEINEKTLAVTVLVLTILGYLVKVLFDFFQTKTDVKSIKEEVAELKANQKALEDSDIKEIRADIRKIENDFKDLKNAVEMAILEGNKSIEGTVKDLHIELMNKITALTSIKND